jgi:hypothetical protein
MPTMLIGRPFILVRGQILSEAEVDFKERMTKPSYELGTPFVSWIQGWTKDHAIRGSFVIPGRRECAGEASTFTDPPRGLGL